MTTSLSPFLLPIPLPATPGITFQKNPPTQILVPGSAYGELKPRYFVTVLSLVYSTSLALPHLWNFIFRILFLG
jgi:hypothetical protein